MSGSLGKLDVANHFPMPVDIASDVYKGDHPTSDAHRMDDEAGVQEPFIRRIVMSRYFEFSTLFVIFVNAIYLGIETDLNHANSLKETAVGWRIMENLFCIYFTVEILCRFAAFERKADCLQDGWFVFDSSLVVLMVAETWVLPLVLDDSKPNPLSDLNIFRLLRLLRLSRLTRLMRQVPELLIIVKGIVAAMRSVGFVLFFLSILDYTFAIVFTGAYKPVKNVTYTDSQIELQQMFGNLGMSMLTLCCSGTLLDDVDPVVRSIREDNTILLLVFFVFMLLSSFTVLNMLIGILFDVVHDTETEEKEKVLVEQVRSAIWQAFELVDQDGSGLLSRCEFEELCHNKALLRQLRQQLGIDTRQLVDMKEILFDTDDVKLDFEDFVRVLLRLRSDCPAGPLDVLNFRKEMLEQERIVQWKVQDLQQGISKLSGCGAVPCNVRSNGGRHPLSGDKLPPVSGGAEAKSHERPSPEMVVPPQTPDVAKLVHEATHAEIVAELRCRMCKDLDFLSVSPRN